MNGKQGNTPVNFPKKVTWGLPLERPQHLQQQQIKKVGNEKE